MFVRDPEQLNNKKNGKEKLHRMGRDDIPDKKQDTFRRNAQKLDKYIKRANITVA